MLSADEEKYIQKIPEDKIVKIKPFNIREQEIAEEIISKIHSKYPDLKILHMGASGLGISGQGDLDIYVLADPKEFGNYLPLFIELFGVPKNQKADSVAWKIEVSGYPVEIYLTDPESVAMKRQIAVFEILKNNRGLLSKYEALKAQMGGKSFKDYQRKKYEFYHRILGE